MLIRLLKLGSGERRFATVTLFARGKELVTNDIQTPSDKIFYDTTYLSVPNLPIINKTLSIRLTSIHYWHKPIRYETDRKVHVFTRIFKRVPSTSFFHFLFLRECGFVN